MSVAKEKMTEIIQTQPEDSSYEEILRELFFVQMIERGLMDVKKGNVISNEGMQARIKSWQK
jgi:predicted transcriptional regulator